MYVYVPHATVVVVNSENAPNCVPNVKRAVAIVPDGVNVRPVGDNLIVLGKGNALPQTRHKR